MTYIYTAVNYHDEVIASGPDSWAVVKEAESKEQTFLTVRQNEGDAPPKFPRLIPGSMPPLMLRVK